MFNYIGYIIAPELYVSAFERINPMSGILSFSGALLNQVHYEWIQMTVKFCKYVVYGLCIYWFYISFYIDIKKQRKTFSKRYIKNGSLYELHPKNWTQFLEVQFFYVKIFSKN